MERVQKQFPDCKLEGMEVPKIREIISSKMKENYKLNTQLIRFEHIPVDIKEKILNTYTEYEIKEIDGKKIVNFFTKNKMRKHLETWNNHSDLIKSLG